MSQLGAFLAGVMDEGKKVKQADKVARAMYDFMAPEAGADGSVAANPLGPKDQWDTLSSQDRIARATAFAQAESLKRAMADQQMQEGERKFRTEAIRRSLSADDALAQAMRETGQMNPAEAIQLGQGPIPLPAVEPSPDRFQRAMANNPQAVNARNYSDVSRAMGTGEEADIYNVVEGKTATGTPYVTYGKQFAFDPAATTEQRFNAQSNLLNERERLMQQRRQKLSASDLLKSYQADLESLSKAWDMPADERAARRVELTTEIEALRKREGQEPGADASEVIRTTKDGKRAVFDLKTKKFLRYAD